MARWVGGIAALLLLLAGCGAVEHEPDLAAAVDGTAAEGSWRFELRGTQGEGSKKIQISCDGAADYVRTRLDIACEYEGGAFAVRIVDGVVYAKERPGSAKWTRSRDEQPDSVDELSPHKLLSILREATVASEHLGEESVRGVSTARYRLTVDCDEAELEQCEGERSPVEVWIADDDTVRRIWVETLGYSATMEFFAFGADVVIQPPPADEIEEEGRADSSEQCGEAATPIRASRAMDALRRGGFSMNSDTCSSRYAAAFDNVGFPHVFDEGFVSCTLYDAPQGSATKTVVRREVDADSAEFVLANLECLFSSDPPDLEKKIDRLERVFAELERDVRR